METIYKPEGMSGAAAEGRRVCYSRAALEHAMKTGEILEACATVCDGSYSLSVDLGTMRGIIRREDAADTPDGSPPKDIAIITRVGKPVCFCVMGFAEDENGEEYACLSRRAAQRRAREEYLDHLIPGDVIPARITHMEQFGAFVDVGCGIVSLLSVDAISVSRISHPKDRFTEGMGACVVIRSVEPDTGRIYVSHKELLGTWEENAAMFSVGETVTGVVRSVEEYGVFVELAPNLAGLAELREGVAVGQTAAVYIKNIIPQRMKVKLALVDTCRTEARQEPIRYFIRSGHIDRWVFSPSSSDRVIMTDFSVDQRRP